MVSCNICCHYDNSTNLYKMKIHVVVHVDFIDVSQPQDVHTHSDDNRMLLPLVRSKSFVVPFENIAEHCRYVTPDCRAGRQTLIYLDVAVPSESPVCFMHRVSEERTLQSGCFSCKE